MTDNLKQNRAEILGAKFGLPTQDLVKRETRRFDRLVEDLAEGDFRGHDLRLQSSLSLLCLAHLQLCRFDANLILENSSEVFLHYFCEDRWGGKETQHADKSRNGQHISWFSQFSDGLLPAVLCNTEDLKKACLWVEADLPDDCLTETGENVKEIQVIYKLLAEWIGGTTMDGLQPHVEKMLVEGPLRCKKLLDLIDAAKRGDKYSFCEALENSLKEFKPFKGSYSMPVNWVAKEESIIYSLAEPELQAEVKLPPKLNALLITRDSLGI